MVLANILSLKTLSWLLWAFMWLVGVLWACVVVGGSLVLWACGGVSIMRVWGKGKANPLKKHKKNLTRGLKKSYTNYKGE